MLNQCNFIGNLGKNPQIRKISDSREMASFSIACSEFWKDKQTNEWKNKTQWIPIIAFVHIEYIKKFRIGDKIYVQGKFQTREYIKDDTKEYVTRIILQDYSSKIINLTTKEKIQNQEQSKFETTKIDDNILY